MSLPQQICTLHGLDLLGVKALSGGDINEVYKLDTHKGSLVLKLNDADRYPGMFRAEGHGLETLASARCFRVPKVQHLGSTDGSSYLLMEYVEPGRPGTNFWEDFGRKLAQLHQNSQPLFGLEMDNYIGSLPQANKQEETLLKFYVRQRLRPQIEMARETGYTLADYETFEARLSALLPEDPPALLHGDLWSGNYLVDQHSCPVLIDPAVCYGPREMDLAMMRLFGGFPEAVWRSYYQIYPLQDGWEERVPIWQLYYLLVHLNLFGTGYLGQVERILQAYS